MRKTAICILALLFGVAVALDPNDQACDRTEVSEEVLNRPSRLQAVSLPNQFEWSNVNGVNFLTNVRN
jgi:hypothetical protein